MLGFAIQANEKNRDYNYLNSVDQISNRNWKKIMLKLLAWQWESYQNYHQSKTNLLIHIVAVPAFLLANLHFVFRLIDGSYLMAILSLIGMIASIAIQGIGHKKESTPSIPFNSAANAIARLLLEQWINFPRFVLTGGWWRAWRATNSKA